jgi:hypothetical protein
MRALGGQSLHVVSLSVQQNRNGIDDASGQFSLRQVVEHGDGVPSLGDQMQNTLDVIRAQSPAMGEVAAEVSADRCGSDAEECERLTTMRRAGSARARDGLHVPVARRAGCPEPSLTGGSGSRSR